MRVLVIPNKQKDKELLYTNNLTRLLDRYDCEYTVCRDEYAPLSKAADLFIVLGGDGSIMRASHDAAKYGIPILSVNLGRMGYMAELEKDEIQLIDRFFSGDYNIEERMMLSVITPDGREHIALNDAVLSNGQVAKMVSFSLYSNGQYLSRYNADGIIISTPTGSTAYSMSAGGPVVDPSVECLIATPVCPHSLSNRPVIFSEKTVLTVKNETDRDIPMFITVDGGDNLEIGFGESVIFRKAELSTKLVRVKDECFYRTLSKKMNQV
ncbi:MAG: NAD(+)/NADH kinase [Clostridia bacterium]|nr:NAD(+)/NADH kinase [Clostridia bacterium]